MGGKLTTLSLQTGLAQPKEHYHLELACRRFGPHLFASS